MTKRQAKRIAVLMWTELAETGGTKKDLSKETIAEISKIIDFDDILSSCSLCHYFMYKNEKENTHELCIGCPLFSNSVIGHCYDSGELFFNWGIAQGIEKRKEYAKQILKKIKEWKVK